MLFCLVIFTTVSYCKVYLSVLVMASHRNKDCQTFFLHSKSSVWPTIFAAKMSVSVKICDRDRWKSEESFEWLIDERLISVLTILLIYTIKTLDDSHKKIAIYLQQYVLLRTLNLIYYYAIKDLNCYDQRCAKIPVCKLDPLECLS